jgi:hypothetical protein
MGLIATNAELKFFDKGIFSQFFFLQVRLHESRPLSKTKHYIVAEILRRTKVYVPPSPTAAPVAEAGETGVASPSS